MFKLLKSKIYIVCPFSRKGNTIVIPFNENPKSPQIISLEKNFHNRSSIITLNKIYPILAIQFVVLEL